MAGNRGMIEEMGFTEEDWRETTGEEYAGICENIV